MSTDLRDQIRRYAEHVEDGQTTIAMTELRSRLGGDEVLVGFEPWSRRPWAPRHTWAAVAAAVVVVALFGIVAWLAPGREGAPPVATTVPVDVPETSEPLYFVPSEVPEGYALRDLWPFGNARSLYLAETGDTWLPTDGGFSVSDPAGVTLDLDRETFVDEVLASTPGAEAVTVAGGPGVVLETVFDQAGIRAPLIWVLGFDSVGHVFEVSAVGMTRERVLEVADGVHRLSVEGSIALATAIPWDVRVDMAAEGFSVEMPSNITEAATSVQVAFGADLLWPRLFNASQGMTVVTTEDGEVVDSEGQTLVSNTADLYLRVPEERIDNLLIAYPGVAELSPNNSLRRVDRYLGEVVGRVISESSPTVLQAKPGPAPGFDTSSLGVEIPLNAATSVDDIPPFILENGPADAALGPAGRPILVIGTARQPDSASDTSVTAVMWYTGTGVVCEGSGTTGSMGSGCGSVLRGMLGFGGASTGGDANHIVYTVTLDTSVVQILTDTGSYWQRPNGGYGVIPFGDTVAVPRTLVGFDADGAEIGRWENDIMP
jgi:hypothetical protein